MRIERPPIRSSSSLTSIAFTLIAIFLVPACSRDIQPKVNRNPRSAYEAQVSFEPSVPPGALSALAGYEVEDERCIPLDYTKAIGGARLGTYRLVPIEMQRTGDKSFTVRAFDDFYIPTKQKLFGNACVWKLSVIGVNVEGHGRGRHSSISKREMDLWKDKVAVCDISDRDMDAASCIDSAEASHGKSQFVIKFKRI